MDGPLTALRGRPRRPLARAGMLLAAAAGALALVIGIGSRSTGLAAAPACTDSTSPTLGYVVHVCVTVPGTTLTGTVPVSATVTKGPGARSIQRVIFVIDASVGTDHEDIAKYVLSDFEADSVSGVNSTYSMNLDTRRWGDGPHTIGAIAFMNDPAPATCDEPPCDSGWPSNPGNAAVTFSNGFGVPPPNTNTFTPRTHEPPAGTPLNVVAVGDGASGETASKKVVSLVAGMNPNLVLYLGDVYQFGSKTEFDNFWGHGNPTEWGRFFDITDPVIGNHEYFPGTKSAPGYFDYWDNVPHYYSFNSGGWHFVALDSTSQYNQMSPGTPQYEFLKSDLAANTLACTLVMFHHPLFDTGEEGATIRVQPVWELLDQYGVDIAMIGHDHDYQRWVPLNGAGNPSDTGVTEFVVGTGGRGLPQGQLTTDPRNPVFLSVYGALRMQMTPTGTTFEFRNEKNQLLDQGAIPCSGPRQPPPVLPPITEPTIPTVPTVPTTPTTTTLPGTSVPTVPTTPTVTTPKPVVPKLAVKLPKRKLAARAQGRFPLQFAVGKAAKVTAELRFKGRRVYRISARVPKGRSSFVIPAPHRTGTYVVLVSAQAGKAKGSARGTLVVKPRLKKA